MTAPFSRTTEVISPYASYANCLQTPVDFVTEVRTNALLVLLVSSENGSMTVRGLYVNRWESQREHIRAVVSRLHLVMYLPRLLKSYTWQERGFAIFLQFALNAINLCIVMEESGVLLMRHMGN